MDASRKPHSAPKRPGNTRASYGQPARTRRGRVLLPDDGGSGHGHGLVHAATAHADTPMITLLESTSGTPDHENTLSGPARGTVLHIT